MDETQVSGQQFQYTSLPPVTFALHPGETVVAYLIDVANCPSCNEPYHRQERRPNGNRSCVNRHTWIRTRKEYIK